MPKKVVVDGVDYVPATELSAQRDLAETHRRTLALAHMHLTFGRPDEALNTIRLATDDTYADALAIRSLVAWAAKAVG